MALEVDGETVVAVVTAPALGVRWWATRGGGAFESTWPRDGIEIPLAVSATATQTASAATPPTPLPLVELVRGQIDSFLAEGYFVWDHAPWILLVEEAGGKFTDRTGGRSPYAGGGLYSNSVLHDDLVATLGY